ncbi:hypothetical protein EDB87DRAFT_1628158, partial [Lactarius vividus]
MPEAPSRLISISLSFVSVFLGTTIVCSRRPPAAMQMLLGRQRIRTDQRKDPTCGSQLEKISQGHHTLLTITYRSVRNVAVGYSSRYLGLRYCTQSSGESLSVSTHFRLPPALDGNVDGH